MRRFSLCFLLAALGCDGDPVPPMPDAYVPDPTVIHVRFDPDGSGFYRMPWPSDSRLTAEGTPDMTGFGHVRAIAGAADEIESRVHGFATMPVVYAALDSAVSESSLPQGRAAMEEDSAIQLIDLSEEACGTRLPLEVAFAPNPDDLRDENMLEVANAIGTVLTPRHPYGLVVLRTFGAPEGRTTARPRVFDEALRDESGSDALSASLAPLRRCLPSTGVALDDVAFATVFTPQDPLAEMRALHDYVVDPDRIETREVADWKRSEGWSRRRLALETYTGTVQMPVFQDGETPYERAGGSLVFDADGQPVVQRWEDVPVAVAMATFAKPPPGPRPVLVFIDGTGWEPWDHLGSNWVREALANGYVVMSFMPQFHGGRAGFEGSSEVSTFNLANPAAIRSNFRQQAAETSYFVRLIREQIADLPGLPELDTANIVYGGHSQGALCGAIVAGVDDQFRGFVFSGLSSFLTMTILYRKDIADFSEVVGALYHYYETFDRWNPLLQLLQMGGEVVDPHNYVGRWHGWPEHPQGNNVFVSNGHEDATTTPRGIEHMTMTANMPVIDPPGWDIDPMNVVIHRAPVSLPVQGDETSMSGDPLTIATYLDPTQGHGTIYRVPFVRELAASFWNTAREGVPLLASVREYQCGDDADEDRDGATDCDDPDCVSTPPCIEGPCDNTMDEDGNGLTDCDDPVCAGAAVCGEVMCGDALDDDDDGATDCDDSDCAGHAPCAEQTCNDGIDGDGDGATDCADDQCAGNDACRERSCGNEADDDGDGMIDCADPECLTSTICPETNCAGGDDDDTDGLADCADPDCASACPVPHEAMCASGGDDDGDGAADCADADCALAPACAGSTCADGDLGRQIGAALFTGTLEGAGNDYPPGDCIALGAGGDAPDIALTWTAPVAGDYILSTIGSEVDTILTVLGPDCDPLNELACGDNNGASTTSALRVSVADGQSIVIVIGARDPEEDAGPVVLHIYRAP